MITVTITSHSITVSGHAARQSGVPPGNNIVCAAVSALTLTLVRGLKEIAGERIYESVEMGHVKLGWDQLGETGRVLIDTWFLGIRAIQENYGEITIV